MKRVPKGHPLSYHVATPGDGWGDESDHVRDEALSMAHEATDKALSMRSKAVYIAYAAGMNATKHQKVKENKFDWVALE